MVAHAFWRSEAVMVVPWLRPCTRLQGFRPTLNPRTCDLHNARPSFLIPLLRNTYLNQILFEKIYCTRKYRQLFCPNLNVLTVISNITQVRINAICPVIRDKHPTRSPHMKHLSTPRLETMHMEEIGNKTERSSIFQFQFQITLLSPNIHFP